MAIISNSKDKIPVVIKLMTYAPFQALGITEGLMMGYTAAVNKYRLGIRTNKGYMFECRPILAQRPDGTKAHQVLCKLLDAAYRSNYLYIHITN